MTRRHTCTTYSILHTCAHSIVLCLYPPVILTSVHLLFFILFQEAMALWSVWWQLRKRGPDAAQCILPPPDAGPDRHHCSGWFPPGPHSDLLQAAGAQRGDPRHDPPRPGVPGRHNLPPRLQCLRDKSLTGPLEPPTPSIPTLTSPATTAHDPSKTTSTSFAAGESVRSYRGGPAPTYMAAASSCMSAAPPAELQTYSWLPPCTTLIPTPHLDPNLSLLSSSSSTADSDTSSLDFPTPPNLFSLHSCSNTPGQPDFTLPHTQEPGRSYLDENTNVYYPFRGHSSHSSPLLHLHSSKHLKSSLTSNTLPTVASEPTLLTYSDTNTSPIAPQGSHLPHFPCSPYKHSSPSPIQHTGHDTVLTHAPARSSSLLPIPPPPPPCPANPGEAAVWGCCCALGGAAAPLSRYLGKVGHAALPLLKVGGLLNDEPSDVQT